MLEYGVLHGFVGQPCRSACETVDLERNATSRLLEGRNEAGAVAVDKLVVVEPHFHVGAEEAEIGVDGSVGESLGVVHILNLSQPLGEFACYEVVHEGYLAEFLEHFGSERQHAVGIDHVGPLYASGIAHLHAAVVGEASADEAVGRQHGRGLVPVFHLYRGQRHFGHGSVGVGAVYFIQSPT